jgi:hypothetical protein
MEKCACGHPCHCKGKGQYLNSCVCIGYNCSCVVCVHVKLLNEENNMIKKCIDWVKAQWKKFTDWIFKGFYK